jgi:hypothetical protein
MKGVNFHMYAAIMSELDVSLSDVRDEITKMGFQVVGSELEEHDDIPRNVILWIMFGFNRLERNPTLPTKYIRVASITHPDNKTYFRVLSSPWWIATYYHIKMWVQLRWEKLKLFLHA